MSSPKIKPVWKFTNGIELNEKEFLNYIERKVFKTIRRFDMLKDKADKEIPISKMKDLNTQVLNNIIKTKFSTKESKKPLFSSDNLSGISEKVFLNILNGKFGNGGKPITENRPLYLHSDKEIQLYAKFKKIKGISKKRDAKIQNLFKKFMIKNPDLEHNVVNAFGQLK